MTFTSIILILLSAFCHALWNFYSKSSRDTRILFFWCGFYTVAIAFIAFGTKHPVIPRPVWIYIIASALVHLLYRLFLTHAYTVGEISFVYPIARAAPAFLPLFAFLFLNERISVQGLVGILCVMASIVLYQQREARIQFTAFLRYLREPDSLWAYATLASVIGYSLIDKQGMSEFHRYSADAPLWRAVTYYLMENSISQVLYGLSCLARFPHQQIAEIGRTEWKRSLAVVGLSLTSYSLILYVLMTEKVSYVTAVRQCSVIFVVLLGGYALKEAYTKRRLIAAVVMVLGIFLIAYQ
ncbi:EamA family transporter [Candidatus Poribacteria bacterium]|nr:EamA family transporter [Candidatus Poribacteria bacterium]MYH79453.1 EamA family transporter [Candidatus Poribacteria bacterium]